MRRSGWRCACVGELRESTGAVDLLQDRSSQGCQGVHQSEEKRVGGEGGARAHQRRRIRPEMSAGLQGSDEQFCYDLATILGVSKGERERSVGAIYSHPWHGEGGRVSGGGDGRPGRLPCARRSSSRGGRRC
jgi:hypothetical protein